MGKDITLIQPSQTRTIQSDVQINNPKGDIRGREVSPVKNNQSTLKGLIWNSVGKDASGFALFATTVAAGSTVFGLIYPDLLLTPYVALPIISAVTAYTSLKVARICINNSMFHLDDRNATTVIAR